jgi:hydroxypyruvate reductase
MFTMSSPRVVALSLLSAAIKAADPAQAIHSQFSRNGDELRVGTWRHNMAHSKRIVVIGAGKASARMAGAVEAILGERITAGVVIVKYGHGEKLQHLRLCEAAHPIPDEAGVAGVAALEAVVSGLEADDLVIACWSGGASALLPAPRNGLTLADKQAVTQALLASGADISVVNAVRKHCSRLKGGQLARLIAPARVLCLVVSDVVGDDLATIGSGPFVADPTTFAEVEQHLSRWQVTVPANVRKLISDGVAGHQAETPKAHDPCFTHVHHHLIASNTQAIAALAQQAQIAGYEPVVWQQPLIGEARSAGATFAAAALRALDRQKRVCLIAGGETTVTLGQHPGKGGRNQEFALAAAGMLAASRWLGQPVPITILAAGTDGTDGPTDAAGAIIDGTTKQRGDERGFDLEQHLNAHNAYPYLSAIGDLIITGATGTNVMDVDIALVSP